MDHLEGSPAAGQDARSEEVQALDGAEEASDEVRLETLERLHDRLEAELEGDGGAAPGGPAG